MASKVVEEAVEARLAANWNETQIFTENQEGETPSDGSPFIILQFPVSNTRRLTVNNRCFEETGVFRIIINAARGEGMQTIRDWGAELSDIFQYQTFDSVRCMSVSEPFTDESSDQGNYFQGTMVVDFWRTYED